MDDTIVFDIETQKSFDEVGGRDKLHLLGLSVLAAYSYKRDKSFIFEEKNISQFQKMIDQAGILVGFNSNGFDVPIIKHYGINLDKIYSLDLMESIKESAGFRISLDNIVGATLGGHKTADGLQAIRWYKEGKMDEIKKYCVSDVILTKNVYEYGKNNSHIFFINKNKEKIALPVRWLRENQKNIKEILEEAFKTRKSVNIEYISTESAKNNRLIDIFSINNLFIEAFCHLRGEKRKFKFERIVKAELTDNFYKIESDVQSNLF